MQEEEEGEEPGPAEEPEELMKWFGRDWTATASLRDTGRAHSTGDCFEDVSLFLHCLSTQHAALRTWVSLRCLPARACSTAAVVVVAVIAGSACPSYILHASAEGLCRARKTFIRDFPGNLQYVRAA